MKIEEVIKEGGPYGLSRGVLTIDGDRFGPITVKYLDYKTEQTVEVSIPNFIIFKKLVDIIAEST